MVLVTIHVRPRNGYAGPKRIKTIAVDSSHRLEQVVADLKLDTKKGITLFGRRGNELALNTSLASNNVLSGDIIESCSCPLLASVLSAVLNDLNLVQALPEDERTREKIEPLLDLDGTMKKLDPWTEGWTHENVKDRIMCLAFMKKVIQRHDRFANLIVPQCNDLMELYAFLQSSVFSPQQGNRRTHNSMAHIFKPNTKRTGTPSTCWQLLQLKLDKVRQISAEARSRTRSSANDNSITSCEIEAFLAAEKERQDKLKGISTPSTGTPTNRRKTPPSAEPGSQQQSQRKRRRLALDSPSTRLKDQEWTCMTCKTAKADSLCLTDACPFNKALSCHMCFSANHPILQRNHECVKFSDSRAKTVLKALHRQGKQDCYCPQYASGPFAILCTLYKQMQQGQLSLDESRLKELAQPICRSNLYDHQARGRNAFACIEGLMERDLVRMERLPGARTSQEGIYSLLPAGETLAKYCHSFEQEVALRIQPAQPLFRGSRQNNPVKVIVDTREDQTYAKRLMRRCEIERVPCEQRELPAGDYLFVVEGKVCPIVVERKSWSDLADSVLGKGRQQRRLDCVSIREDGDSRTHCENGRCQLCKMKASGCSQIMFVIEGARCEGRDESPQKCTSNKRCQFCREIQQRHGSEIVHEKLEEVLFKLQVEHGCFVQYTRSYNETIQTLMVMRDIVGESMTPTATTLEEDDIAKAIALSLGEQKLPASKPTPLAGSLSLTYEQFCSNARRKGETEAIRRTKPSIVEWSDSFFTKQIFEGNVEASINAISTERQKPRSSSVVVDLNDSFKATLKSPPNNHGFDDSVVVLDDDDETKDDRNRSHKQAPKTGIDELVNVDSDDEDDNSVVEVVDHPAKKASITSDDEVEVVYEVKPSRNQNFRSSSPATVSSRIGGSKLTLLLLNGLYSYDFEYYKFLSDLWKALYNNYAAAAAESSVDDNEFRSLCAIELQKHHVQESPLVARDSVLFWVLALQIRNGVHIQVTRMSDHKDHISRMLGRSGGRISSVAAAAINSKPESEKKTRGNQTFDRSSSPCSETEHSCPICRNNIVGRADNIEVTPCMHRFHSKCLTSWLTYPKGDKRCPICKHDLGTYRKEKALLQAQESSKSSRKRPPLPHGNSEMERLRLARLARFERPAPHRNSSSTSIPSCSNGKSGWNCSICTLWNDVKLSECEACGNERVKERSISNSASLPSDDSIGWNCSTCTLLNEPETTECSLCGNPSSLSTNSQFERPLPSFNTPPSQACAAVASSSAQATSGSVSRSKAKCGACGEFGHNRGTATEANCSMYFDQEEINRRAKKAEECKRKAREAKEKIEKHQRESATVNDQLEEAKRALARLEQAATANGSLRENEVERLKKAQKRAEKRARKYE